MGRGAVTGSLFAEGGDDLSNPLVMSPRRTDGNGVVLGPRRGDGRAGAGMEADTLR